MKLNLHNLNHCDSLTSVHSAIQSQHQGETEASPKDNKKNYLKLKISTKSYLNLRNSLVKVGLIGRESRRVGHVLETNSSIDIFRPDGMTSW
ncbi:CLUMA_CG007969, isoform A [Clunio marinus]|uniref:CLUMA_CG007969, isoform A n=1 Tax=Clunio marinus TaxID=568069 RepID=A0A1J1I6A2_9DIPT|nr:CLUMA_CG007969, isoform A [Clunio marinus]